ncbi:Ni/Co efflux regulator RcnB [Kibdelosporangium banguiense]|uniref:Ni/Co efflux regulator RcnB n=1 Tax=Kibdelosporangium banguiense TaxID=1365924 RepID=A0ABS4TK66_9PSEU|nr:hypothetical protein [Kibdelosporangium banguiense]MBP2324811.1 Ni/Co efflux regulator RcnB [Kibdelosporangium banguiense]
MDPNGSNDPVWTQTLREAMNAVRKLNRQIGRHWRESTDKQIQSACDDVELTADFIDRCFRTNEVPSSITDVVRKNDDFVAAFAKIRSTADDFAATLFAIDKADSRDRNPSGSYCTLVELLSGLADSLRSQLHEAIEAFIQVVNQQTTNNHNHVDARTKALSVADDIRSRLKARQLIHEAERARIARQKADSDRGTRELAEYYLTHAAQEGRRADWLRTGAAILLVAITGGAVCLNFLFDAVSVGAELVRLSATVPIAVLAGYLAKESSNHRRSATWANHLAIAMQTLPDYVQPLGDDGVELRRLLGQRVFGAAMDQTTPPGDDGLFDELPRKVADALNQLRDTIERRESRR